MKIKKGDLVRVLSGKDKGTEGHVMSVDAENNRVTVEGVHTGRKHQPPTQSTPATLDHTTTHHNNTRRRPPEDETLQKTPTRASPAASRR